MAGAGAVLTTGISPHISYGAATTELIASVGKAQIAPENYPATEIWGYDGQVPGPAIRVKQGDRVRQKFVNKLPQASTVHWHGIRIDNRMDGVPDLTQKSVAPGDSFEYDFKAPDAGTYWFHPHNKTWEQMARGLYGALIIEEPNPPQVDDDLTLLIDDWRLTDDASIAGNFGSMMDWSHGGRLGNWITINGGGNFTHVVKRHQRLRLRLVNVSNSRIFTLNLTGMDGWIVAMDGQPLLQPEKAKNLTLAPAQRIDLIVDVTADAKTEAFLVSSERQKNYAIAAFPVGAAIRGNILAKPEPLPENPIAAIGNLKSAKPVNLTMEGGAMGRMGGAILNGAHLTMRELVGTGNAWAFNGVAGMTDTPLASIEAGQTVIMTIANETSWPHAMHLHGHHFRQVAKNNSLGPLRDTLLMQRGEITKIAFVADNPGKWLFHCHMLEHAASGMMTWLEVG